MGHRFFRHAANSLLLLGLFCLTLMTGCSQTAKTDTSPLFWKAQSETSTVYFLGSIHVGVPDIYPLDAVIMDAYKRSDCLVLEPDVTSEPVHAQYGQGSLEELLGAELLKRTVSVIKEHHAEISDEELDTASYTDLLGWLTMSAYSGIGLSSQYGVDSYFLQKAIKDKKVLTGVETYAQIAEDATKYPPEYMAYMLESLLATEAYGESTELLFTLWCAGDKDTIEETQITYLRQEQDRSELNKFLYQFSILERNNRMVQKAQEFLDGEQSAFFVVGLAHLLGEEGMISQLENMGYVIEEIPTK